MNTRCLSNEDGKEGNYSFFTRTIQVSSPRTLGKTSSRTLAVQFPYSSRTVPVVKNHSSRTITQSKNSGGSILLFLHGRMYGNCSFSQRELYGNCTGTGRVAYGNCRNTQDFLGSVNDIIQNARQACERPDPSPHCFTVAHQRATESRTADADRPPQEHWDSYSPCPFHRSHDKYMKGPPHSSIPIGNDTLSRKSHCWKAQGTIYNFTKSNG